MNHIVANALKEKIADLSFIDVLAGLTRIQKEIVPTGEGGPIIQSYPVECAVTSQQFKSGDYLDLGPDSGKRSIIYFEDLGVQFKGKNSGEMIFHSRLRLVGWLNLQRFVDGGCSVSAMVIANIIKEITSRQPFNISDTINLTKVKVIDIAEAAKNADIFLKYSLDETILQHLMYPFDYFALDITTEFTVPFACVTEIQIQDPQEC